MESEQPNKKYAADEVARRAKEIYERDIHERIEPGHAGRYLVVDVESGDHEIGDEALAATRALRERNPAAITYLMRVGANGAKAAYRLAKLGRTVTAHS